MIAQKDTEEKVTHPAKYSNEFIPIFAEKLQGYEIVLDIMAGTGKIGRIKEFNWQGRLLCNEIEPEFTKIMAYPIDAWFFNDAAQLPFRTGSIDAICTSPTYANRLADHWHQGKKNKHFYFSYTFGLRRDLNPENTGHMQWSEPYRIKHWQIYKECYRTLRQNGRLIITISDHIRKGQIIPVAMWHKTTLLELGFKLEEDLLIPTRRLRCGENYKVRVEYEHIFIFKR
jgi:SAM-dependent methyltransferase